MRYWLYNKPVNMRMGFNGLRGRKQMYKCKDCNKQFIGGQRRDKFEVITDYVEGKQTLLQIASKYKVSERTIRRDLESMRFVRRKQSTRR